MLSVDVWGQGRAWWAICVALLCSAKQRSGSTQSGQNWGGASLAPASRQAGQRAGRLRGRTAAAAAACLPYIYAHRAACCSLPALAVALLLLASLACHPRCLELLLPPLRPHKHDGSGVAAAAHSILSEGSADCCC